MAGRAIKVDSKAPKNNRNARIAQAPDARTEKSVSRLEPNQVAVRSYELWLERGCPLGSPEIDWFAAEEELRKRIE